MPKVSIIIPFYNRLDWTNQAVQSVLKQTYKNLEIILIDDGSPESYIQKYPIKDTRIKYLQQENKGRSSARNYGLKEARGEYIIFLDSDDELYLTAVESLVSYLDQHPEADIICGAWIFIDSEGKSISKLNKPTKLVDFLANEDFPSRLTLGNMFPIHASLTRKRCIDAYGGFNPQLDAYEDWDLWLRLVYHGCKIHFMNDPVARYRRHDENSILDIQYMEDGFIATLDAHFTHPRIAKHTQHLREHAYANGYLMLCFFSIQADKFDTAQRMLLTSLPFIKKTTFCQYYTARFFKSALSANFRLAIKRIVRIGLSNFASSFSSLIFFIITTINILTALILVIFKNNNV